MDVVNPATGVHIETYEQATETEVSNALRRSSIAFEDWRERSVRKREQLLATAGDVLRENKRTYAEIAVREMGKPISQAIAEIEKSAWVCDHYAEYAGTYLAETHHPSPPGTAVKTAHEPLGPVLAVMPWNFPFYQVFRFAAPAVTAGNVGVLKHASNVPGCALAIDEVFREAGYPDGVFQSLLIPSDRVDNLIADDRIRAVTLTGSDQAGRAVAASAGDHLKKTVLELGGSDPFVILDDADIETAAEAGAWARTQNGGQSCIAAKRFLVQTDIYDAFLEKFVQEMNALEVGEPMDEDTDVGPQAREHLMEELHTQVEASITPGAETITGGEPLDTDGAFYPPAVLVNVPGDRPVDSEETFGPIAAVYEVDDDDEAVRKVNDTDLGLGASVWPENRARGERIAGRIDAGCVYVNKPATSDPRVPFGGVKNSGYGRELSEPGVKEFVNRKTVWAQ